jgi:hypothetical protein
MVSAAGERNTSSTGGSTAKLYAFVVFVAFMSTVASLMGPAVVVLLVPTPQWTSFVTETRIFSPLNSPYSPAEMILFQN